MNMYIYTMVYIPTIDIHSCVYRYLPVASCQVQEKKRSLGPGMSQLLFGTNSIVLMPHGPWSLLACPHTIPASFTGPMHMNLGDFPFTVDASSLPQSGSQRGCT
jgi:hypothetical protein